MGPEKMLGSEACIIVYNRETKEDVLQTTITEVKVLQFGSAALHNGIEININRVPHANPELGATQPSNIRSSGCQCNRRSN